MKQLNVLVLLLILCLIIPTRIFCNKKPLLLSNADTIASLSSGDIILFKHDEMSVLTKCITYFSHVGIVLKTNDQSYILENHAYGDATDMNINTGGVHLHNLHKRLITYKGNFQVLKLNAPLNNAQVNGLIDTYHDRYKKFEFKDNLVYDYIQECFLGTKKLSRYNCSEFIMTVLNDLGMINENVQCKVPDSFIDLPKYRLQKQYFRFSESLKRCN